MIQMEDIHQRMNKFNAKYGIKLAKANEKLLHTQLGGLCTTLTNIYLSLQAFPFGAHWCCQAIPSNETQLGIKSHSKK